MAGILRNVDEGVRRLMLSMHDLGVYDNWPVLDRRRDDAAADFQTLYKGYLSLLRVAHGEAHRRWEGTVRALQNAENLSEEEALESAHEKLWAGPGGDPNVLWVVRLIWLECDRLNTEAETLNRVRPETLLLQWLIDDDEDELVKLLACMPYWPIGLDEDGNWC